LLEEFRMKICYLDAFSGISGDMTVGALVDAGADAQALVNLLDGLKTGAHLRVEKTRRAGMAASKFIVEAEDTKQHRHLPHILEMIAEADLPDPARKNAVAVFQKLAEAEASMHGVPIEKVHFHEVGAIDSICDIVGACVALALLNVGSIYCSAINVGSGTVQTEHGVLPIPAPATAALLRGLPIYSRGPAMELTTPTGAAIVAALAVGFGPLPPMRITSTGHGAGDRDFPGQPNVLRVLIGEGTVASEAMEVSVIEANADDATPQILGYAMERLLLAGALDVTLTPVLMKKNRPGTLISVIARPADRERLCALVLQETPTLGVRFYTAERRVKERHFEEVNVFGQCVKMKIADDGAFSPEYDDCRRLAQETGRPLSEVIAEANFAYLKNKR
jgi:pyridinium-3,5-bisthiocarboxylic acid mononucleotide nickel chelatase